MQQITPNLWFNGNAKEAVDYYMSVFKDGKITKVDYYPSSVEEGLADFQVDLAGDVLTIEFEILGTRFVAINAGPEFSHSEAVSFLVPCKDQDEIDYYWSKLSTVPESEQCGWCKDQFGISWQIVLENMDELMAKPGGFARLIEQKKIVIDEY
jgi:predicted 3-demethylubiquinone-9 3-methyltransferase (glyoxalase superfamily)